MDRFIQVTVREDGGQMLISATTSNAEKLTIAIDAPLHVPASEPPAAPVIAPASPAKPVRRPARKKRAPVQKKGPGRRR